jgi:hypothetical protein
MDLSEFLYANNFTLGYRAPEGTNAALPKTAHEAGVAVTSSGFRIHSSRRVAAEERRPRL